MIFFFQLKRKINTFVFLLFFVYCFCFGIQHNGLKKVVFLWGQQEKASSINSNLLLSLYSSFFFIVNVRNAHATEFQQKGFICFIQNTILCRFAGGFVVSQHPTKKNQSIGRHVFDCDSQFIIIIIFKIIQIRVKCKKKKLKTTEFGLIHFFAKFSRMCHISINRMSI